MISLKRLKSADPIVIALISLLVTVTPAFASKQKKWTLIIKLSKNFDYSSIPTLDVIFKNNTKRIYDVVNPGTADVVYVSYTADPWLYPPTLSNPWEPLKSKRPLPRYIIISSNKAAAASRHMQIRSIFCNKDPVRPGEQFQTTWDLSDFDMSRTGFYKVKIKRYFIADKDNILTPFKYNVESNTLILHGKKNKFEEAHVTTNP